MSRIKVSNLCGKCNKGAIGFGRPKGALVKGTGAYVKVCNDHKDFVDDLTLYPA